MASQSQRRSPTSPDCSVFLQPDDCDLQHLYFPILKGQSHKIPKISLPVSKQFPTDVFFRLEVIEAMKSDEPIINIFLVASASRCWTNLDLKKPEPPSHGRLRISQSKLLLALGSSLHQLDDQPAISEPQPTALPIFAVGRWSSRPGPFRDLPVQWPVAFLSRLCTAGAPAIAASLMEPDHLFLGHGGCSVGRLVVTSAMPARRAGSPRPMRLRLSRSARPSSHCRIFAEACHAA